MRRLAVALLLAATPVAAESNFDVIFKGGTLDGLPEGTVLAYDGAAPLTLVLEPGQRARIERAGGATLGTFDSGVGNPVAMAVLEDLVGEIAEETGGSPYYIRNRIRDQLGAESVAAPATLTVDGAEVAATEVVLRPFAEDAHRAELGDWADLTIRVVMSEALPGWYGVIEAGAPNRPAEVLTLDGVAP